MSPAWTESPSSGRQPSRLALVVFSSQLLFSPGCDSAGSEDLPPRADDDDSGIGDDDLAPWEPTFEGSYLFRYDHARTGATEVGVAPDGSDVGVVWSEPAQGILGLGVVEDTIFCLSVDGVRALAAATGSLQWTAELSGLFRGPAVADGRLVVEDFGGRIAALDAANGSPLWQAEVNDGVSPQASPLLFDGVAFVGGGGSGSSDLTGMHAFDLATGAALWTFRDEARWTEFDANYVEIGPASLDDGVIYFAAVGSECANSQCDYRFFTLIYALDAETGTQVWRHEMPATWDLDPVAALPIAEGKVVVSGLQARAIGSTTLPNGKMVALDASSGAQSWLVDYGPSDGRIGSNPAVADGAAYVGIEEWDGSAWNRYMAAYRLSDGERLWATPIGGSGATAAGPFVVYVSSTTGDNAPTLIIVRSADGVIVDQESLAGAASGYSLPIVHQGLAFVLTSEQVYAIRLPDQDRR